ncbi:MAG TPA: hypothetical protein VFS15_24660 [Kofleriaceae bacterium]|nr:hypothetical protein [Kofleriaceae bacterium]
MRLDRKLLLIAPAIVLMLVVAGMLYASAQLHLLAKISVTEKDRSDFIAAVAAGKKPLDRQKAVELLQWQLEVESRRTSAIAASRDLLIELSAIAFVSCIVLGIGIRGVPRQHWPRFGAQRGSNA